MENLVPATGAIASEQDKRTVQHETMTTMAGFPLTQGGYDYELGDIEHQHYVGICTAISLTQNAAKALGKKFSADFQYLLQKRYMDGFWDEGSSIFSALKVGKKYGFLPLELFADKNGVAYITEFDRVHSDPNKTIYQTYVAKLKSIPDSEIQRLLTLCTDKLSGYAQIDVKNTQAIAKAISDSKAGILCMYNVGEEWYKAKDGKISWNPTDINPLRPPNPVTSSHAITYAKFDYSAMPDGVHANTWGTDWNRHGLGDIVWSNYKPVEGWIPYYELTPEQTQELRDKLVVTQSKAIVLLNQFIEYLKSLINNKK